MEAATTRRDEADETTEESFVAAWGTFMQSVRRARGRAARQHGSELTLSQYHVLNTLSERPEARIGELAEAAEVAPPTATRMLDGLEREGVVTRVPSESDRRCVTIELTEKGRRLLARKRRLVARKRRALFESLSSEEREQAERLLHRLAAAMDEL